MNPYSTSVYVYLCSHRLEKCTPNDKYDCLVVYYAICAATSDIPFFSIDNQFCTNLLNNVI